MGLPPSGYGAVADEAVTEMKLEIARQPGSEDMIDYSGGDLKEPLRELTGGNGADVCLDAVGGDPFDAVSRATNHAGRPLVVGFSSGTPQLAANLSLLKAYAVVGVCNPFVLRKPERNATQRDFVTGCEIIAPDSREEGEPHEHHP
jgi:NADPH:quinone reductase